MSRNRCIATLTIALAVVGSACSTGGSETPGQAATPAVAAEPAAHASAEAAESPADETVDAAVATQATTESATPADDSIEQAPADEVAPTMSGGEAFDAEYVAELVDRIDAATTLDDYLAAMSAFVVYMDSSEVEDGTTSGWEVDENAYAEIAAQFGITELEVEAAIAADPVLSAMIAEADFVSTPAEDETADVVDGTDEWHEDDWADADWSDDDWSDDGWHEDDWSDDGWHEDDWYDDVDPVFVDPTLADLIGPWGAFGDQSCAASTVMHIESAWESYGSGSGSGDGFLIDAHADLVGGFASVDDASEVMSVLGVCEAARQAEQFNAALGFPGIVSDLTLVTDDLGDVWALRVYQDVASDTVVVFVQEYEQIVVYVSVGQDEYTAVEEAYAGLGH